jgi:phage antirepressor YoqD-like protein
MDGIISIKGIDCYEENGVAYLKLETVARGLGFTTTQTIEGKEYTNIRWSTVKQYLNDIGLLQEVAKDDFIPENIFYRLAMKAKNEAAEKFQAFIADEVIPTIRKHGMYLTPETLKQAILTPDYLLAIVTRLKEETDRRTALEAENGVLLTENTAMQPKAEYFDDLVDRHALTSFRETAKLLKIGEKKFIGLLLDKKFIYRDNKGKLLPYSRKNKDLFGVKETKSDKTNWSGTQTLITPKGRQVFRELVEKDK